MGISEFNPFVDYIVLKLKCSHCGKEFTTDSIVVPSPDWSSETHHGSVETDYCELSCDKCCGQIDITMATGIYGGEVDVENAEIMNLEEFYPDSEVDDEAAQKLYDATHNEIEKALDGQGQFHGLNLVCFHHSIHLLWQCVDLSFLRPEIEGDVPQRLFLSACKRLKQGSDYLFYSVLRCLELASIGAYELSKCLPLPSANMVESVLWVDENSAAKTILYNELADGITFADMAYTVLAKAIDHAAGEEANVVLMPLLTPFIHESGRDVYGTFHLDHTDGICSSILREKISK